MGCYDSVIVPCPACGKEEYFQSKSGDCILQEYPLKNCPMDVLYDVNRHSPYTCESCGLQFAVDLGAIPPKAAEFSSMMDGINPPSNGYQPIGVPDTLPKGGSDTSSEDDYRERCVKAINYIWQMCYKPDMIELMRILQGDRKEWFGDIEEPPNNHKSIQSKYDDLIMSVHNKYPNESRHETAKRYIIQREQTSNIPSQATTEK